MERIKLIDKWFLSIYMEQKTCFKIPFAFLDIFAYFYTLPNILKNTVTELQLLETLDRNISSNITKIEDNNLIFTPMTLLQWANFRWFLIQIYPLKIMSQQGSTPFPLIQLKCSFQICNCFRVIRLVNY